MSKTVVGSFDNRDSAKDAVEKLRDSGFSQEISVLARSEGSGTDNVSDGATTGGVLGGLAGLALGAGALAIPGIGPILAAGPIAGVLSGAATGGLAGGLIDWGIPANEGKEYEEDVKQGKTLVSVRSDENRANQAAAVLRSYGSQKVRVH